MFDELTFAGVMTPRVAPSPREVKPRPTSTPERKLRVALKTCNLLKEELDALKGYHASMTKASAVLLRQHRSLDERYAKLEKKHVELLKDYAELKEEHDRLTATPGLPATDASGRSATESR